MYKIAYFTLLIVFFNACGSSGTNNLEDKKTAYLIDSPISGVEYQCNEIKGLTSKNGEFNYSNDCKVIFKIGGVLLGEIDAKSINKDKNILPADLFGMERENVKDEKILRFIQFLQSIDSDNNPENSITITENVRKQFKNYYLDFTQKQMDEYEISNVLNSINRVLISKEKALKHYKKTLKNSFNITIEEKEDIKVIVEKPIEEFIKPSVDENLNEDDFKNKVIEEKEDIKVIVEKPIEEFIKPSVDENLNEDDLKEENFQAIDKATKDIVKPLIKNIDVDIQTVHIEEKNKEEKGFSYENQRDVNISIKTEKNLHNKQILLYEKIELISTPIGDIRSPKNLIISTVFDENSQLNIKYTFANHIRSIWLSIPYYNLYKEIAIEQNNIFLNINNQGE